MIKYWDIYFLLCMGLVGCQRDSSQPMTILPATVLPSSMPSNTATIPSSATPSPTLLAPPTQSPSPTPTVLLPTATPLPLFSSPCGLYMPILPASLPQPTSMPTTNPAQSLDNIPENARAAVSFLLNHPEDVALVAYRVGQEGQGIFHNPDLPMPTASVVKIIHLLAYAEAVNAGSLNPADWVPLADLDAYYLPRSDLNAHAYALEDLTEQDLIAYDPPEVPLEQIPWMMIRHSSNAATDYLHQLLGQEAIEQTALKWGFTTHTAPCPFVGQFLLMGNHLRRTTEAGAIQNYQDDALAYGADVMRFTDAYSLDPVFYAQEQTWRNQSRRSNYGTQALFTRTLHTHGTARQYAGMMATIAQNQLDTSYMNIVVRRYLEWPMIFPINQEQFWSIGYKGGSLPGVLTGVYYAEPINYRTPVVVAIFYRNLPRRTYQEWRQTWTHDELARWLLADETAIPTLKALLP